MVPKKYNLINMNNSDLKKLSKSELIKLLLKQNARKPMDDKLVPKPRRPVPTPRKSVKHMVKEYEDNIILPPPEFGDVYKPIPLPRTKKPLQAPIPTPRTKKPSEKQVPEHIDEQYEHAKNVWNTFKLQSMGEYHDLYLKSDVLLLADVFENFRKTCIQYYKLDPCHYFTSPGLSWDAMLKMTDIKLKLITDIDMYQFIEKGMRGGISYIANRHGKANNKYMNEKAPSKYIMYLDANNLYGWAMSQYLPTGNFKWLSQKQIEKTNLGEYTENSKK